MGRHCATRLLASPAILPYNDGFGLLPPEAAVFLDIHELQRQKREFQARLLPGQIDFGDEVQAVAADKRRRLRDGVGEDHGCLLDGRAAGAG